jgi:hypothetical protein
MIRTQWPRHIWRPAHPRQTVYRQTELIDVAPGAKLRVFRCDEVWGVAAGLGWGCTASIDFFERCAQAEVANDNHGILALVAAGSVCPSQEEIVGFDITMDDPRYVGPLPHTCGSYSRSVRCTCDRRQSQHPKTPSTESLHQKDTYRGFRTV